MVIADMLLKNGKIATMDARESIHQAVAVKDGRIIDVGSDQALAGYAGPDTRVIDLGGKLVLPAAHDAHMHATLTGLTLREDFLHVGTPDIRTMDDLRDKIAAAVAQKQPGEWIYGSGFLEFLLPEFQNEGRGINRWDIDPVSPDNPVMLTDFGLHTLVVNSKALALAGLDKDFPDIPPEEGMVERDPVTGDLNGRFFEWSAHHLIGNHVPMLDEAELEACISRVQQALNAEGATSHTDIIGPGLERIFMGVARTQIMEIYERMHREGKLTARVSLAINPCPDGVESYDKIMACLDDLTLPEFSDRNWVKAETMKLFGDWGWWLRATADKPDGEGRSIFPGQTNEEQAAEIHRIILELHRRGWQVCNHAIGGMMVDVAVDAYAEAQQVYPRESPRHFVIHADDMTRDTAKKMAKFNILASPQPIACNIVAPMRVPMMTAGEEVFDWQAYMDEGCHVAGGSDAPCFSFNWREGVQFAVTRKPGMGDAIRPDLGMKLTDAIRMYTSEGAYQEGMETERGSIEISKVADFQVLGRDIFTCPPEEIAAIPVVMTICDGKVVYEQDNCV